MRSVYRKVNKCRLWPASLTSWGGTSKETVRRSTLLYESTQGITKKMPGPWKLGVDNVNCEKKARIRSSALGATSISVLWIIEYVGVIEYFGAMNMLVLLRILVFCIFCCLEYAGAMSHAISSYQYLASSYHWARPSQATIVSHAISSNQ